MKKVVLLILIFSLILVLSFASVAHAASSIDGIHQAKTIQELEQAMRATETLADEIAQFDALTYSEQYDVLTDLMVRKNQQENIDGFKELFAKVYEDATTYMNFVEGYPYITGESKRGAYVVVKTDISGWVYLITLRDGIVGGISDSYDFMKYYHADNGENKTKVWVQGGVETKIPAPAQFGSGWTYRAYLCLKGNGNVSPDMTMVKYKVDRFYYFYNLVIINEDEDIIEYDLYFTASDTCNYEGVHYIGPGPYWVDSISTSMYTTTNVEQGIDYEFTAYDEVLNYIEATLTFEDGSTYHDTIYLPGPVREIPEVR